MDNVMVMAFVGSDDVERICVSWGWGERFYGANEARRKRLLAIARKYGANVHHVPEANLWSFYVGSWRLLEVKRALDGSMQCAEDVLHRDILRTHLLKPRQKVHLTNEGYSLRVGLHRIGIWPNYEWAGYTWEDYLVSGWARFKYWLMRWPKWATAIMLLPLILVLWA